MQAIRRILRAILGFFARLGNVAVSPFKTFAAKRAAKRAAKPAKTKKVEVRRPDKMTQGVSSGRCKTCKMDTGTSTVGLEPRQGWLRHFFPRVQFAICDKCGGKKRLYGTLVSIGGQPV